ncbi:MAG: DUF935 family protein [Patescibacteria group bacterium]|nr:DUF935 family protein [Patescibacteria group bacterium]
MPATLPVGLTRKTASKKSEPTTSGSAILPVSTSRIARDSGLSQMQYMGTTLDVQRIQNSFRAAERGQTWLMMTIIRDMCASFPHLMAEWGKRKAVICGQPMSLLPEDSANPDDVTACEVIREAIKNCRNWQDSLQHLLDATLYPISAAQKVYQPIEMSEAGTRFKYLKRYFLKEIAPINHLLECYEVPYRPAMGRGIDNPATQFDADQWESWLRFYSTEPNGMVDYTLQDVYAPDPNIHIIHRGCLYSPSIPPNFGGIIRAILFLYLFATQDRDWWTLMMAKYGMSIPVAKVDSNNATTMAAMRSALVLGVQLGGIVIDKKSMLEWSNVSGQDGSAGHKMYQDFVNSEVSKLVVGQVTSARPEKGGLAAGMAEQAETVRDDIRTWDTGKLSNTLETQLFPQILSLNGYRGSVKIFWGGARPEQLKMLGASAQQFYSAGLRASDKGIRTINEKVGIEFERVPDELLKGGGQAAGKPSRGKNSNDDGE